MQYFIMYSSIIRCKWYVILKTNKARSNVGHIFLIFCYYILNRKRTGQRCVKINNQMIFTKLLAL